MANKKELKGVVTISFNWWEVGSEGIYEEHEKTLQSVAGKHIKENILKGFTSGELPTQNHLSFDAMYTGFWKVETKIQ
jgi:hypothetical protein